MANGDAWTTTYYCRAIQNRVGEALRMHFDQERSPMPHRLFTLLMQLNEPQNLEVEKRQENVAPAYSAAPDDRYSA
jgi:hypothetical protein